ncbi:hypothetical protein IF1G_01718 [Cordyceps javanica]|uniref:Uncharacterized protein n=1 Tax=Cordyceps javanica TaxID=43265 RepID=A0A545VCS2_9HYPO|nr:hypothetical protein IF1G_01718 [Cordyceps javanica]
MQAHVMALGPIPSRYHDPGNTRHAGIAHVQSQSRDPSPPESWLALLSGPPLGPDRSTGWRMAVVSKYWPFSRCPLSAFRPPAQASLVPPCPTSRQPGPGCGSGGSTAIPAARRTGLKGVEERRGGGVRVEGTQEIKAHACAAQLAIVMAFSPASWLTFLVESVYRS